MDQDLAVTSPSGTVASDPGARVDGGWAPQVWLGAPAPGGLALPDAHPRPHTLYAPRGVHLDADHLIVADTGNHRVMIWPADATDHSDAAVVLGQPDPHSEGPAAGGPERGLNLPTGVIVHDGRLVVADAWHHRVLVFNDVPTRADARPDLVIGQPDHRSVEPNRGGGPTAASLYWPFGIAVIAGRFYIADTGNRRVLCWFDGIPATPDQPADCVLGQPDPHHREENRGGDVNPRSFRWPHDLAGDADTLFVADAGNHRVLGWAGHPECDRDADLLLGQPSFTSASEFPYGPQSADGLRFPYAAANLGRMLAVADTANNRVLVWTGGDAATGGTADAVLGQPSFAANGENRWTAVEPDTLCWPYGIATHHDTTLGERIAVADSGNNRVIVWSRR